jgi:hypothetical protein
MLGSEGKNWSGYFRGLFQNPSAPGAVLGAGFAAGDGGWSM